MSGLRVLIGLALAVAVAAVAGCDATGMIGRVGQGAVTTETRGVAPFQRIDVSNGIRLVVRIDPGVKIGDSQPVEVAAQPNLFGIVETKTNGGTLQVRTTQAFTSSEGIEVRVVTSALDGVTMSGGSRAQIDGLDAGAFGIGGSGGAVITANGQAETVDLDLSGGSRAELGGLTIQRATVDVSGGSVALLRATASVSGSASGGSRVTVAGGATLDVQASGGSEVKKE